MVMPSVYRALFLKKREKCESSYSITKTVAFYAEQRCAWVFFFLFPLWN